jgi:hypothetical protein
MVKRIFEPKKYEGWKKLHYKELHNLYALPDNIRMMNSRSSRYVDRVALMGVAGNTY